MAVGRRKRIRDCSSKTGRGEGPARWECVPRMDCQARARPDGCRGPEEWLH